MSNFKKMILKPVALLLTFILSTSLILGCGKEVEKFDVNQTANVADETTPEYHVIVCGSDPEGISAALSAARNGMKTLLITKDNELGGLFTLGELNFLDMSYGPDDELLTRGIFKDFYKALGNAFDIQSAKDWFAKQCANETNLTLITGVSEMTPIVEGTEIVGISTGDTTYSAYRYIDCTTDADIAAAAGVPYTVGGEDYGRDDVLQACTLVFEVTNLDWHKIKNYLNDDDSSATGADSNSAWGYGDEASAYTPVDENMRLRGPNIAKLDNGNYLLNCLLIFGIDALNEDSLADGIARGEAEIPYIVNFMKSNFVGFENVEYVGHAEELYVRETRHIQGEYRLTIADVLENAYFDDQIAIGSYPVDIQATDPSSSGLVVGKPTMYSIPYRCIVPLVIDNLLVASRSSSYNSLAHGSTRVVPVGMCVAEAAGVACSWSIAKEESFRDICSNEEAINWIQDTLTNQGAYIKEYVPAVSEVQENWAYEGVKTIRELGQAYGNYSNQYNLDDELPNRWALMNKLNKVMTFASKVTDGEVQAYTITLDYDDITIADVICAVATCYSQGEMTYTNEMYIDAYALLHGADIINDSIIEHIEDENAICTYDIEFAILGNLYNKLTGK